MSDFGESISLEDSFSVAYFAGFSPGGAPRFLPPEIMLAIPGKKSTLDYAKSDVFGLGMTLYLMLQGVNASPFSADDHSHHLAKNFVEPANFYDEDIRVLVRDMLSPDPQLRPLPQQVRDRLSIMDARDLYKFS